MQQPTDTTDFTFSRVGTTGCEIRDQGGRVIAWTVDQAWAEVIVALLNKAEETPADALKTNRGDG